MVRNDGLLVNIILDRSGSMAGLENDVIGHFNSYIEELRYLPNDVHVSLFLFDHEYEQVYINRPVKEVPVLSADTYFVRGSTALLDAVGRTIRSVDAIPNKPNKVIFVINTDGYENASKEFTKKQIKADITERQANHDWQFVFIGAGIDAFAEAGGLGIKAYSTLGTASTPDGIKSGYYNLTNSTVNYANNTSSFMDMTVTTSVEEEEGKKKKVTSGASS